MTARHQVDLNFNLEILLESFRDNLSLKRIKICFQTNDDFIFKHHPKEGMPQEIIHSDGSKATMY